MTYQFAQEQWFRNLNWRVQQRRTQELTAVGGFVAEGPDALNVLNWNGDLWTPETVIANQQQWFQDRQFALDTPFLAGRDLRVALLFERPEMLRPIRDMGGYGNVNEDVLNRVKERWAYVLKMYTDDYTWHQLAMRLGFRTESAVRAAARRFYERAMGYIGGITDDYERLEFLHLVGIMLPPLTQPNARRTAAAHIATAARWARQDNGTLTRRTNATNPQRTLTRQVPQPVAQKKLTRNFGVELEFVGAEQGVVKQAIERALGVTHIHVYGYHGDRCLECAATVPAGQKYAEWKMERDGSVTTGGNFPYARGGEVVSPVLNGPAGYEQVLKVTKAMRDAGARINRRAGLHVHIDMTGTTTKQRANLLGTWQNWQHEVFKLVARSRRNNTFCRPVHTTRLGQWAQLMETGGLPPEAQKYDALNITPFPRIGTYEFRLHHGTLNGKKIVAWVKFLIAFVEYGGLADMDTLGKPRDGAETIVNLLNTLNQWNTETQREFGIGRGDVTYFTNRVATFA